MEIEQQIPKYKQETQLFINPKNYYLKKNEINRKKIIITLFFITIIFLIIILLIYIPKRSKKSTDDFSSSNNIYIINNDSVVYNTKTIKDSNFFKYQQMLPHLSPDLNINISSIDEIFKSRQLYISDAKITPEYIKYLRPINETEEEKYKKRYSEGETIIDNNLFKRRSDQYNYNYFCQMALEDKIIDKKKITYDNKPLISIVITAYNKKDILLKSIRSIQNQKFTNIEIIIVNDCSTDNSVILFDYLLKTDPRIRIFHHIKNMGCWRSRLDGIIYSRGKYVILFDTGDLYEDNYVLLDAYNVISKYNLDSVKFLFRIIRSFQKLNQSYVFFHVGYRAKIVYEPNNIKALNSHVFSFWGNVWNRLVRANIFTKAILSLNELLLNIHKNVWDDTWFNKIIHNASYSYAVFERVGYVYLQNGLGEGSPRKGTEEEKNKAIKEYVGFLCFDHHFSGHNITEKQSVLKKLKEYNETHHNLRLQNFRTHFEVLNNFLESLIKDSDLSEENRTYCKMLLKESIEREKKLNTSKNQM